MNSVSDLRTVVAPIPTTCQLPRSVLELLDRIARTGAPILLLGERGTGKTTLARQVHLLSRREGEFIPYQLGAVSTALHLSDLFGHVRGAYTGAERDRTGLVEAAAGGTLFLDELGAMSPRLQKTLLALFDTGYMRRQGEDRTRPVTARIVGATNQDLDAMAARGRFRLDLLDRFGYFRIELPPLRQRQSDILPLFSARVVSHQNCGIRPSSLEVVGDVQRLLTSAPWPGNLRQLDNVAKFVAVMLGTRLTVELGDFPPIFLRDLHVDPSTPKADLDSRIRLALARSGGNVARAAREMGVNRRTLHRRLRAMGDGGAGSHESHVE